MHLMLSTEARERIGPMRIYKAPRPQRPKQQAKEETPQPAGEDTATQLSPIQRVSDNGGSSMYEYELLGIEHRAQHPSAAAQAV